LDHLVKKSSRRSFQHVASGNRPKIAGRNIRMTWRVRGERAQESKIATGDLRSVSTCDIWKDRRELSSPDGVPSSWCAISRPRIAAEHAPCSLVEEFFGVADFRQIIVLVDVNAELDFLQFRAGRPSYLSSGLDVVFGTFRNRQSAHRRIGVGRFRPNLGREFELYARRRLIS